jgi:hypothetical protein
MNGLAPPRQNRHFAIICDETAKKAGESLLPLESPTHKLPTVSNKVSIRAQTSLKGRLRR